MKNIVFILLLMLLFNMNISFAEELKLCGVEWPPFTYSEHGKIVKGISFEVYTEVFRRLQVNFKADEFPWPRCLKYVKKGTYDAIIDAPISTSLVYDTFPTAIYPLAIYVRHDFPQETFSWKGMKDKRVGMVRGYYYTEKISQFNKWKKDLATTEQDILRKLKAKRYDYVILDIFSASSFAKKASIKIKRLTPLIDSSYLYLTFNKDKAEITKQYNKIIGEMIQDGTMDTIYQKYLPYNYTEVMDMKVK